MIPSHPHPSHPRKSRPQTVRLQDRLDARLAHSYRRDPAVPPFPDDKPVIVFDGVCVLCSGFARFVAGRDPARQFRFVAAQSPLGHALYTHFGLDPVNYETNLLLAEGRASGKIEAFVAIMRRLGGVWQLATLVGWLPIRLADPLYDRIAQNRYRLFGRRDSCIRPDASWLDRVIE